MHHIREALTELGQKVVRLHAGLACHALYLAIAEDALLLRRRNRLIRSIADPGLRNMPQTGLFEAGHKTAETAGQPLPWTQSLPLVLARSLALIPPPSRLVRTSPIGDAPPAPPTTSPMTEPRNPMAKASFVSLQSAMPDASRKLHPHRLSDRAAGKLHTALDSDGTSDGGADRT
jgi:hypothetical protein